MTITNSPIAGRTNVRYSHPITTPTVESLEPFAYLCCHQEGFIMAHRLSLGRTRSKNQNPMIEPMIPASDSVHRSTTAWFQAILLST